MKRKEKREKISTRRKSEREKENEVKKEDAINTATQEELIKTQRKGKVRRRGVGEWGVGIEIGCEGGGKVNKRVNREWNTRRMDKEAPTNEGDAEEWKVTRIH